MFIILIQTFLFVPLTPHVIKWSEREEEEAKEEEEEKNGWMDALHVYLFRTLVAGKYQEISVNTEPLIGGSDFFFL